MVLTTREHRPHAVTDSSDPIVTGRTAGRLHSRVRGRTSRTDYGRRTCPTEDLLRSAIFDYVEGFSNSRRTTGASASIQQPSSRPHPWRRGIRTLLRGRSRSVDSEADRGELGELLLDHPHAGGAPVASFNHGLTLIIHSTLHGEPMYRVSHS